MALVNAGGTAVNALTVASIGTYTLNATDHVVAITPATAIRAQQPP